MVTRCGSCKTVPVYIVHMKCFNFFNEHSDHDAIILDYCKNTGSGIDCPHYSRDLTPYDFFYVRGYRKNEV